MLPFILFKKSFLSLKEIRSIKSSSFKCGLQERLSICETFKENTFCHFKSILKNRNRNLMSTTKKTTLTMGALGLKWIVVFYFTLYSQPQILLYCLSSLFVNQGLCNETSLCCFWEWPLGLLYLLGYYSS